MNGDARIPHVDVLAVGAHPDDTELGVGGIIAKYARTGTRVAILDLTRGELGTRGSVETREEEAAESARILGVAHRGNAALPDGALANTTVQQHALIPWLRQYRPKVILCQMSHDRHPDHRRTCDLVRDANFFAGLRKIGAAGEPYRAPHMYFYAPYYENIAEPNMVIDITDTFDAKLQALRAYRSQFYNPEYEGEPTYLSTQDFWDSITLRARYWGGRVGVRYGEPLVSIGPLGLELPPAIETATDVSS